jgi:hypothetical protein
MSSIIDIVRTLMNRCQACSVPSDLKRCGRLGQYLVIDSDAEENGHMEWVVRESPDLLAAGAEAVAGKLVEVTAAGDYRLPQSLSLLRPHPLGNSGLQRSPPHASVAARALQQQSEALRTS